MSAPHVLILGGTAEAAALAEALARTFGDRLDAITSLAGKTAAPRAVPGRVKSGGFGGAEGLAAYLRSERIGALVDATHPFARAISAHAAAAAASAGVPRLVLTRAPWAAVAGDDWIEVPDAAGAVEALAARPDLDRVFLTLGSGGIAPFAKLGARFFAVRVAERPTGPVPLPNHALIADRGPFSVEKEIALLEQHRIAAVVSKNAGGPATYPKIEAARTLRLPVVMIARPAPPEGPTVTSVADAVAWVARAGMPAAATRAGA